MMRSERQGHGFTFEEYVEQFYNVDRSQEGYGKNYTDRWDGKADDYAVSIKHIKKGNAVDLGDIFRQAITDEDFFMIVDFYETPTVSESDEIHFLFIPANNWRSYFLPLEQFETKFKNALNAVTNNHEDDAKWTKLRNECVTFWKNNSVDLITANGKRDHKKQKRWQCSINKTNFFKEFLPKYEITEEEFYAKRNKK